MPTTLQQLASGIAARIDGDPSTTVRELAYDSRDVPDGSLFFCVPGARTDGHDHAGAAAAAGAAALVVERPLPIAIPQIRVASTREAMGPISDRFFDHPSRALTLVGITGTNGKTTSVYMAYAAFRALGMRAGLIGNIERRIDDVVVPSKRNTPEAPDLQRLFARMRDARVDAAAMEVTSEGIAEGRIEATRFACGVFTNLTQDHLNYHGTMEAYFEAKVRLFEKGRCAVAVVNTGDAWGRRLHEMLEIPVVTYASEGPADVSVREISLDRSGSDVVAVVAGSAVAFRVPIPAPYNVTNALGVLACAHALGFDVETTVRGIERVGGVPGRVEPIDAGQPFTVLVDYAHTPDSLDNVLRAARTTMPHDARLIVVFGCGGDRDTGKRPLMGKVATELADHTVITSDNPRTEDPAAIIAEIEAGVDGGSYESTPDRRDGIARAIAAARPGDVVVIAGKGHETGQEFAGHTVPFDDRVVARELLEASR